MEKAEDFPISHVNFTAVKYIFLYFHGCQIQLFKKYALYLFNIFLYFITLYIINIPIKKHENINSHWVMECKMMLIA